MAVARAMLSKDPRVAAPGMCSRQPSYAAPGSKAATHCALHKLAGQVDVKNQRYQCRNPAGCDRLASFGHVLYGRALFCARHKASHHVNVRRAQCNVSSCARQASYVHLHSLSLGVLKRYCSDHTFEGCVRRRLSSTQEEAEANGSADSGWQARTSHQGSASIHLALAMQVQKINKIAARTKRALTHSTLARRKTNTTLPPSPPTPAPPHPFPSTPPPPPQAPLSPKRPVTVSTKSRSLSPKTTNLSPKTINLSPKTITLSPKTTNVAPDTINLSPKTTNLSPKTIALSPAPINLSPMLRSIGTPCVTPLSPKPTPASPKIGVQFGEVFGGGGGGGDCPCGAACMHVRLAPILPLYADAGRAAARK
eukprot:Tamp_16285.p1 GENE.Tamp_16285~~Tamp_16285.p1  ORF type:complete len:394 (-),score=33.01 Tamp_16285:294-1391(-)